MYFKRSAKVFPGFQGSDRHLGLPSAVTIWQHVHAALVNSAFAFVCPHEVLKPWAANRGLRGRSAWTIFPLQERRANHKVTCPVWPVKCRPSAEAQMFRSTASKKKREWHDIVTKWSAKVVLKLRFHLHSCWSWTSLCLGQLLVASLFWFLLRCLRVSLLAFKQETFLVALKN